MIINSAKKFIKESLENKYLWIWVLSYLILSVTVYNFMTPLRIRPIYENSLVGKIFGGLSLFDASSYLTIAKDGYENARIGVTAFFPFYPIIIRYISYPFRLFTDNVFSIIIIGTLFNVFCLAFSLNFLKKIIKIDYPEKVAQYSQFILLLFPFSFFFLSLYTESIFLLAIISSFYFARNKRWLLACIIAIFASAIRLPGILLAPALFIEFLNQSNWSIKKSLPKILWVLITPLGAILYFIYIQMFRGGLYLYFEAYKQSWPDRKFTPFFFSSIFDPIIELIKFKSIRPNDILGLLIVALTIFVIYLFYKYKIRASYIVFSILNFVLPLLTGTVESIGRYYMVVFPIIICLSIFFSKNRWIFWLYIIPSAIASIVLMILFINGVFVG